MTAEHRDVHPPGDGRAGMTGAPIIERGPYRNVLGNERPATRWQPWDREHFTTARHVHCLHCGAVCELRAIDKYGDRPGSEIVPPHECPCHDEADSPDARKIADLVAENERLTERVRRLEAVVEAARTPTGDETPCAGKITPSE